MPNSYSRRSCSNKSTLAFQSTQGPPIQAGHRRLRDRGVGQNPSALLGQNSIAKLHPSEYGTGGPAGEQDRSFQRTPALPPPVVGFPGMGPKHTAGWGFNNN